MEKYKFGEFIYNKRKNLGLTQDDLGKKLSVTNKAVSKWETGETMPDISLIPTLANVLGVTIDELLTQKAPEPIIEYKKTNVAKYIIPIIILSILSFILLLTLIPTPKYISKDNILEYYDIDPCVKIDVDDSIVLVSGNAEKIKEIKGYEIILSFTIVYSFYDNSNSIVEILYIDRKVVVNDECNNFSILLEPKTEKLDFKEFESITINYEIEEVNKL